MNQRFQTRQQNSRIIYIPLIDTGNESRGTSERMEIPVQQNTEFSILVELSLMNIVDPQNFNKIPASLY